MLGSVRGICLVRISIFERFSPGLDRPLENSVPSAIFVHAEDFLVALSSVTWWCLLLVTMTPRVGIAQVWGGLLRRAVG